MNTLKKLNLKKLLTLFGTLMLAFCLVFSVACNVNNSSSSSSSSDDDDDTTVTATDYQSIKNGDFEFGTSGDSVTFPVYTGINWTRYRDNSYPTSAVSSTKNSGIIDTDDEAYEKIAETNNFPKNADGTYWNPKTPEYYGLGGDRYVFDEETYADNPNEDKLVTSGSKILMIHNVTSVAGRGTAQKFVSSSSLTTTTGYGKISVWVMTKDLKSLQQGQEYGAYISVNNTLSSSRSPFLIKNIDTQGVWAEYVIYLRTSDYASSSFTVTVGLGFGSDTYKAEYVEGFAYFDEIHYEEIDEQTYETETADIQGSDMYSLFNADGTVKSADELKVSQFGKTYEQNADKKATVVKYGYSHLMTTEELTLTFDGDYNKVYQHNPDAYAKDAESGYKPFNEISVDGVTNPYGETANTAYIKLTTPSSYTLTSSVLTIESGAYKQINFMTNVEVALTGQPGAKIQVEEVTEDGSQVYGTVSVADNFNTYSTDDKDNIWQKVSVFLQNDLGTAKYIRIKLTLGTTDNVFDAADYNLTQGYALFTGFEVRDLPESEYNIVSSPADYKSTITLGYEYPNGAEEDDETEDSFAFTATTSTSNNLTVRPAEGVSGYTGVVGNHTMVGGDQTAYSATNVVSGIVSSKYAANYADLNEDEKFVVSQLAGEANIQPLLIKNVTSASYGYLGSQLTITANTTTLVSVQVKVLGGAEAYVYLANADPLSYFGVLEVAETPLVVKVTSANEPIDSAKWVTVNFVITAGDEDLTYRVELWNGSRYGSVQSQGTVLFNQVNTTASPNVTQIKAQMEADFVEIEADVKTVSHTRANTTVTYTDADGNEATYERTYAPTVVYTEYLKGATIIATYETIHAPTEIDETSTSTDDDTTTDDTTDDTTNDLATANIALQITSIVVAAVLILVLIIIVIRMIVKKNKKAQVSTSNYYNRDSREKAQAVINANKAKRARMEQEANKQQPETEKQADEGAEVAENAENEGEDEKPYDYDNPENNI